MKPFDIKMNYFGGWNRCQQQLSFSKLESDNPISLSSTKKKTKNEGNKV
jgi:hypothetical protein